MHYIKDGPFQGGNIDGETVGVTLNNIARLYRPIEGLALSVDEIRTLNKGRDILEAGPIDGYFVIEQDEVFKMLKRVVPMVAASSVFALAAPSLEDIFNHAATETPNELDIDELAAD